MSHQQNDHYNEIMKDHGTAKHTPGHWFISDNNSLISFFNNNEGMQFICELLTVNDKEREANARLIHSAPDLLEALQTLSEHYGDMMAENFRTDEDELLVKDWRYRKAIEAIRKAEGS